MLVIGGDDVHRVCAWPALVAALHTAHLGPRPLIGRCTLEADQDGVTQTYFNVPAFLPGIAMGTKLATILPDNVRRFAGIPAVQALYALFDGDDGSPSVIIDGTALTYRKTAADSALGSRLLSREDARVLLLVGAGSLAPYLAHAHRAVRPSLTELLVWNRSEHRATRMAQALRADGIAARSVTGLEQAARAADIVSCCTAATAPLLEGAWLKPGCHVDLVGGFTPTMRECDDATVLRARLFVDEASINIDACGDLIDPIRRGVIARGKVEADLYDLCRAKQELDRRPEEITLFKNGGGGHLDLFTALFVRDQMRPRADAAVA